MKREIELLLTDGRQPVYDSIHRRLTGEPSAFVDYIHEVVIKQEKWNKDLDEFCSDEVRQSIIAYLDGGEGVRTKDYVIPRCIASYNRQIFNAYLHRQQNKKINVNYSKSN